MNFDEDHIHDADHRDESGEAYNQSIDLALGASGANSEWPSEDTENHQSNVGSSQFDELHGNSASSSGLYWFWDNAWDDPRSIQ